MEVKKMEIKEKEEWMWKNRKTLGIMGTIIAAILIMAIIVVIKPWIAMMIAIGFAVIVAFLIVSSIKKIRPTEMAIKAVRDELIEFRDSGWHLIWWFLGESLIKRSKKKFALKYPDRKIISATGKYGKPEKEYGTQTLIVSSTVYLRFPRKRKKEKEEWKIDESSKEHPLVEIIRSEIPPEEGELQKYLEGELMGTLRLVLGKKTWKESIEERDKMETEIDEEIKKGDRLLSMVGFQPGDISFVLEEIILPKELEETLPRFDVERIRQESAIFIGKGRGIRAREAIQATMPEVIEKSMNEIQKDPKLGEKIERNAKDLIIREIAAETGSLVEFRDTSEVGDSRNKGDILKQIETVGGKLISIWKKTSSRETPSSETEKPKKKKPEDMSDEEAIKEALK